MSKILLKVTLFSLLVARVATATEFRSPWLSEHGPIRYIFEKDDAQAYSLDVYTLMHRREAHKAFMKHGTDPQPLTALFFNKSDFTIEESFPNAQIAPSSKYYNPFLGLTIIKPRATYYEWGMNLGARFEYPVWKDKGRIGFRTNIPFRVIEIEREDITSRVDNPEDEFILNTYTKVGNFQSAAGALANRYSEPVDIVAKAYNMDFLSRLFQDNAQTPALQFADASARVFGIQIAKDFDTNDGQFKTTIKPVAGVIADSGTGRPNDPNFNSWGYVAGNIDNLNAGSDVAGTGGAGGYGVRAGNGAVLAVENRHNWAFDAGDDVKIAQASLQSRAIRDNAAAFPAVVQDTEIMKAPNTAFFTSVGAGNGYSTFMDAAGYPTLMPDYLKKSWLVLGYDNGQLVADAVTLKDAIENQVNMYKQDPYEWLLDKGYEFETQRRTGLGDIDLDVFYEYRFSDQFLAQGFLGVRLPTGGNDDFSGNPYQVHLGNGQHWEIKLGAMGAWQPIDWINLKLDSYLSFVLEATEQRCAVFQGSTVKNIGPKVDADTDWTYFVTRLDATLFHPKTQDISATLGYEFYYKTQDNIHFKDTQATPLYGPHVSDPTNLLLANLSNDLAAANTESIGHKIRGEVRIQINEWFEIIGGGAFTFAGKNLPRESDAHCGFNIKF